MEKQQSTILDCFPKLIEGNDKERIDGGIALVKYLSDKSWDDATAKELNLALRRLIGGTGSHYVNARKSFYGTLTAYLITKPETPVEKILEIMEKKLEPMSNAHKGENGEIFTGRILTCGALIRSKILEKSSAEMQQKVLEHLISAGKKRSYLPYVAFSFIIDFLNQINKKTFSAHIWPYLKTELIKPWSEQNLETLHTLLFIQDKFPSVVKETYKENFGGENIINEDSLGSIVKILTNIPRIVCYQHPVYKLFIEKLFETEYVQTFWSAIDQRFLKPSKSDEYLATEILRLLLQSVNDKSMIPELLSEKYLQHMLKKCKFNRRKKDEIINAFINVLTLLTTFMSDISEDKIKISILKRLMFYPGDLMIEKWTSSRIIQLITASLKSEGVKKLSKMYKEIIENPQKKENRNEHKEPWTNAERIYTAQLLTKLISHTEMTSDRAWRLKQLKFLFKSGLCESPNIGVELAGQIKVSFYRALDNKLPKLSDLRSMLSDLVTYLDEDLFTKNDLQLRTPLEEAGVEVWKKMITLVKQLEESNDNFAAFFHTMDLHMGLQLFTDSEMAISSIDELHNCFERLRKKSKKSNKKSDEDEPEWTEVVVDLILSLLSRNEHLLRTVVGCVFPHICPHLTSNSLHQILAVLDVKNAKGPLSIKGTEDDDDDSSEDSDAECENEKNGTQNSNSEDEGEDEDEEADSESEKESELEDEGEEDETVTDRLRLAVSQALGGAAPQTDDEDMDVDDIDEDEGKRLDENLAAAFKMLKENRRIQSKKQAKPAEFLTHFRIRVIDLLEAYLDSCPPMALALDMVVPLFMLLEFCIKEPHQKPLENKVKACLKKLSGVKKFKDTKGVDGELLTTLMKILMEKGERSASVCQEMGDQLAKCCMFLVRCSQQTNLPNEVLAVIYKEHLTAFFKKRDCILSILFFKNIFQLFWEGNWILIPLLVDFAFDKEIRSFRRSQALELLLVFYRNARLLKDENREETRLQLEKKLCKNSIKLLNELSASLSENGETNAKDEHELGKEIRQKFVRHLFALLHAVRPHHLPRAWNWQKVAEAMAVYRPKASLSKTAKAAYNKLASQIGAPINTSFKKTEVKTSITNGVQAQNGTMEALDTDKDENESEEEDSPSTKKKKKNSGNQKEKQKLKKEARKLRAEAMSEGLESFDFSSVVLPNGVGECESVENGVGETDEKVKSFKHKRSSQDTPNHPKKKKKTSERET